VASPSTDDSRQKADPPKADPYLIWYHPDLDFPRTVTLRKSYIIASSYRCGSTFLCSELWKTGLLGAPAEYLNTDQASAVITTPREPGRMMGRLQATTPQDYFTRLLACRTSRNGIFGMKAHFHHFEPALSWYPSMLNVLAPITYIYINRRDKVAQAVSMAKAMQTHAWLSFDQVTGRTLRYDADFVAQCSEELERQRLSWWRWFESNAITPFVVTYEELTADTGGVVRSIVELLGAEKDEPDKVTLPVVEKQSDEINAEWMARFDREKKGKTDEWNIDAENIEGVSWTTMPDP
jgi:trehalose 2-sulfotransferase